MATANIPGDRRCYFEEEYLTNDGGYGSVKRQRRVEQSYDQAILIGSLSTSGAAHLPLFDLDYPATLQHVDERGPRAILEVGEMRLWDVVRGLFGSRQPVSPRRGDRASICLFLDLALKCGLIADPYGENPWLKETGRKNVPYPAITFIVPATLLPSSTREHYHLYLEARLDWENQYLPLLKAASKANFVERRYSQMSQESGLAFLLKPGVTKAMFREKKDKKDPEGAPLQY